ncbi:MULTISPECIES: hypothetical protein [Methylobacterium]|jgi:hypothetical protein|uniref:Neuroendocrine-specific golgi family protein P55 (NESP55) n=1 Tax=Methylobacterium goesingense TaxID=243690 RepID=A0ABV2LC41_9HYPH|nr:MULTISPECIES: hypothetical protein [Methylobacterium]MBY0257363.1 hypothetical protein [Methylobacterium sp.]GJD76357.1 hypothetical protein CFIICLFH_4613 [Methylobacterium goesingense]
MRMFLVTFHKLVCDDTGHERPVRQHQVLVPAASEASALAAGQALFCEANGIVDWRLRADSCEAAAVQEELT